MHAYGRWLRVLCCVLRYIFTRDLALLVKSSAKHLVHLRNPTMFSYGPADPRESAGFNYSLGFLSYKVFRVEGGKDAVRKILMRFRSEGSAIVGTPLRLEERRGGLCSIEHGPPAGWEQGRTDHYCQSRHGKRKQNGAHYCSLATVAPAHT